MTERKLRNFDGEKVVFYYDCSTANDRCKEELIDPFMDKIDSAWLCGTRGNQAESHVKNYLSHVASILLAGEHGEILSERTLSRRRAREIPESALSCAAVNSKPVERKPRKRVVTQYDKIRKIKKKYPNCTMSWVRVDTDGGFVFDGRRYRVVSDAYAGKRVKGFDGLYYKFDHIWVVNDHGNLTFYDQAVNQISTSHVFRN